MPTALMQLPLHTNEVLHSDLTVLLPGLQDFFLLDMCPVFFSNPAPDGAFQTLKTNLSLLLQDNWDLIKIQIVLYILLNFSTVTRYRCAGSPAKLIVLDCFAV